MTRLFQIYEQDLQTLETQLPRLADRLGMALNDPAVQVSLEAIKEVLSNVRWSYGPPSEVQTNPNA